MLLRRENRRLNWSEFDGPIYDKPAVENCKFRRGGWGYPLPSSGHLRWGHSALRRRKSDGGDSSLLQSFTVPQLEFSFAAGSEGGEFAGACVVPAEQFVGGGGEVAGVELPQKGGRGQASGAEVEGEVDERVKLALGGRDLDEAGDGLFGFAQIPLEDDVGLGLGDAGGVALGVHEAVAVANGGQAGGVEVGLAAKAFGLFEQGDA